MHSFKTAQLSLNDMILVQSSNYNKYPMHLQWLSLVHFYSMYDHTSAINTSMAVKFMYSCTCTLAESGW